MKSGLQLKSSATIACPVIRIEWTSVKWLKTDCTLVEFSKDLNKLLGFLKSLWNYQGIIFALGKLYLEKLLKKGIYIRDSVFLFQLKHIQQKFKIVFKTLLLNARKFRELGKYLKQALIRLKAMRIRSKSEQYCL